MCIFIYNSPFEQVVFDRWDSGKRDKSLAGFLDYFKKNLVDDTSRIGMPIKRAEYVMAVWRLGLILEKCHNEGLVEDLARIEECGAEILDRDPILATMAGLARLSREDMVGISTQTHNLSLWMNVAYIGFLG